MSGKKDEETLEVMLGTQYGSDFTKIGKGEIDARRFTNINESEAYCLSYMVKIPVHRGGTYAREFVEEFINFKMGVHGWRANQGIRVIAGSKGAPMVDVSRRPGWFGRNVSERRWKEKAEQRGEDVVE